MWLRHFFWPWYIMNMTEVCINLWSMYKPSRMELWPQSDSQVYIGEGLFIPIPSCTLWLPFSKVNCVALSFPVDSLVLSHKSMSSLPSRLPWWHFEKRQSALYLFLTLVLQVLERSHACLLVQSIKRTMTKYKYPRQKHDKNKEINNCWHSFVI